MPATKCNAENERVKHRYFVYLKDAKRMSEASIDVAAKAIRRFEEHTKNRSFKKFKIEQAVAFKEAVATADASGKGLSGATQLATLNALRSLFVWLADQPGYRRIRYSDADYFNYSAKATRAAKAGTTRPVPTPEQIDHVLRGMPATNEIELRDRALMAFTYLTGIRDRALVSLKFKHVDLDAQLVNQDAREVDTKASKSMKTWFFPVGDLPRQIVVEWITFLRTEKLWTEDDPLFPATRVELLETGRFGPVGLDRKSWTTAGPVRVVFKAAFERAKLPYCNPHSVRKTLARLGMRLCSGPEQFKAWSQNLGHDHVMTTFASYGEVPGDRQAAIIRSLARSEPLPRFPDAQLIRIAEVLRREGVIGSNRTDPDSHAEPPNFPHKTATYS